MTAVQGDPGYESPMEFSKRVGLPFEDYHLLKRALTHRSFINEHPEALEDNERLEFLGDAVLDYVVGIWLYNRFPEMSEGDMTRMRAALVQTEQLAEFGRAIDIGKALRLGKGEEEGGGRERESLLCGTFEAVIGALCIDVNMQAVIDFMEPLLEISGKEILDEERDRDPKSRLQEWVQRQGAQPPNYRVAEENGPDHKKTFSIEVVIDGQVYGHGEGRNKQEASKAAAREALKKFEGN
ncbi:MAG: ribonuclease III [Anaerolineae bacterium]|nr:ribonuclease III [Anaerolineae bacterium]